MNKRYYQKIIAGTTRGNQTAGNTMVQYNTIDPDVQGYSTSLIEAEALGNTAAGTLGYVLNLLQTPVLPNTVTVTVGLGTPLTATDDGNGNLVGSGFASTSAVDYATGVITIDLEADPAGAFAVTADYVVDLEAAASLPTVSLNLTSAPVRANLYALKADLGQYASFSFQKRFGKNLGQMVARAISGALTNETMGAGIRKLKAGATATAVNITNNQPAAAVSLERGAWIASEWKKQLAQVELSLLVNAGIGGVTGVVAGRELAAWLSEHPRFKQASMGMKTGPHIFGTIDGVIIIRVPNVSHVAAVDGYCVTKGENFLSSLTRATYMPITVLPGNVNFNNPIQSQQGLMTSLGFHAEPRMTQKVTLV